jgi:hypothetical protein
MGTNHGITQAWETLYLRHEYVNVLGPATRKKLSENRQAKQCLKSHT